jgi:hypothetical protein
MLTLLPSLLVLFVALWDAVLRVHERVEDGIRGLGTACVAARWPRVWLAGALSGPCGKWRYSIEGLRFGGTLGGG